jgi:predicted lysophospholipase L1 biosynthesis ABC-type transport system permease subunit
LRDGADMAAFRTAVERLASERAEEVGGDIFFADNRDRDRRVQRAIRPQAAALLLFAAFAGLAGFLVLGQALSRQLSEDATEVPVLRALGLTRPQLAGLALGRTNLDRIRWTPVLLAGVLGGLALATVGHTLVTSIQRRRRDLAVLKTMGFQRRQVSAAVAWQATTFVAAAALIGLPAGIAVGRLAWLALADQLGIVPDVATPFVGVLLVGPATVLIANLIALVPGWLAGRVPPAVVLRTE